MKKILLLCVLIYSISIVNAAKGYLLEYKFRVGEKLKYSSYYRSISEINVLGKSNKYNNLTKNKNTVNILTKKNKGYIVNSIITSAEGTNNGKSVDVSSFVNRSEKYYFLPTGVYYKKIGNKYDPEPQIQLLLPKVKIGVGSTWEISRDIDLNSDIPELKRFKMKFEYKFMRIDRKNGYKCAVIRIVGKGKQPFKGKIQGKFDLIGEAYFSLKNGRLVENRSKMTFDVKIYETDKLKKISVSFSGKELRKLELEK